MPLSYHLQLLFLCNTDWSLTLIISTSNVSTSPGTTFPLNFALLTPPKNAIFPLYSSAESAHTAPVCANASMINFVASLVPVENVLQKMVHYMSHIFYQRYVFLLPSPQYGPTNKNGLL